MQVCRENSVLAFQEGKIAASQKTPTYESGLRAPRFVVVYEVVNLLVLKSCILYTGLRFDRIMSVL